jgi:hypothetical protein
MDDCGHGRKFMFQSKEEGEKKGNDEEYNDNINENEKRKTNKWDSREKERERGGIARNGLCGRHSIKRNGRPTTF